MVKNRSNILVDNINVTDRNGIHQCNQHTKNPQVENSKIRLNLLPNLLNSLSSLKKHTDDWEIIIVDNQSEDLDLSAELPILLPNIPYRLIKVYNPIFSRGYLLNICTKYAKGEIMFYIDADMYLTERTVIDKGIQYASDGHAFFPICYSLAKSDHSFGWWRVHGYGNVVISRTDIERIGGWWERQEWGREDDKLNSQLSKKKREGVKGFFHQWHPNSVEWKNRFSVKSGKVIEKSSYFTFSVIIPIYNQEESCTETLLSIINQQYPRIKIIIVDDASTDNTVLNIRSFIEQHQLNNIQLLENKTHMGDAFNRKLAIDKCFDDDIVVCVDGGDYLAHDMVFVMLHNAYRTGKYWATFSNFLKYPSFDEPYLYSQDDLQNIKTRKNPNWTCYHLRTFFAWLGKRVTYSELKYKNNEYYQGATDMALCFPILEMAAGKIKHFSDVLYLHTVQEGTDSKELIAERKNYEKHVRYSEKRVPVSEGPFDIYYDDIKEITYTSPKTCCKASQVYLETLITT